MLRELIDIAVLEDFAAGLARAGNLRVAIYGSKGDLIAASPVGRQAASAAAMPEKLPRRLELTTVLPAPEPPARVAFVENQGLWYVVVPVHIQKSVMGFVGVGAFRDTQRPAKPPVNKAAATSPALPALDRSGDAPAVATARWASRMLTDWCLNEARLESAAQETALLGDIGELLSGEQDLQTVLDRVCAETARVMNLRYSSLRLYNPKTDELTITAGYNLPDEYIAGQTILRSKSPIDDEALNGHVVYVEDAAHDQRFRFREEARRLGIVSGLIAGMTYHGEPVGVLRAYADHKKRFRTRHRNLLRTVASQAAVAIANARLLDDRLRSAAMERQLATAGQVQSRMMRTSPPAHPGVESALVFDPGSHVGGDFCDLFPLPDGRLAAVVGDVAGHGMPAALVMASARGALRASAQHCETLADMLTQLNRHVYRETTSDEFVTLLLAAVDPSARCLHYASAGHEPLLLLRAGEILKTGESDLVLGIDPDQRYTDHSLELHPGDFALLYTDGVVEAMDFEGRMFGRDRLLNALRLYGTLRPDQALRNIHWDVRRFVGLADQSDDLTMVGLRIRGAGEK
jgi:serine phosphatase RsbU (regulator of sigma subunit)